MNKAELDRLRSMLDGPGVVVEVVHRSLVGTGGASDPTLTEYRFLHDTVDWRPIIKKLLDELAEVDATFDRVRAAVDELRKEADYYEDIMEEGIARGLEVAVDYLNAEFPPVGGDSPQPGPGPEDSSEVELTPSGRLVITPESFDRMLKSSDEPAPNMEKLLREGGVAAATASLILGGLPKVELTEEEAAKVVEILKNPPPPTQALKDMMRAAIDAGRKTPSPTVILDAKELLQWFLRYDCCPDCGGATFFTELSDRPSVSRQRCATCTSTYDLALPLLAERIGEPKKGRASSE